MAADFYDELGVRRDAAASDIKQAYRRLAMKYHPDRNQGDAEAEKKFKAISHAYDVLKDDQSRAAYDRYGHDAFTQGQNMAGGQGFGTGFSGSMSDIFEDLFSGFRGGRRTQQATRGEDLRHDIKISLEKAALGTEAEFKISAEESCAACHGSGGGKGSKNIACGQCHGSGVIRQQTGFLTFERTCSSCGGGGRMMSHPCTKCGGQGRVLGQRKLRVKIPAGIEDGAQMRLAGKGCAGLRSGPPGDLYLVVHIARHDIFLREGKNLFCTIPVPMTTAALGGEIAVPVLNGGQVSVKLPEGCQTGKRLRVRDKGITGLHDQRQGDLFIDIEVETPMRLNAQQKDLMEKLRDSLTEKNAPHAMGFAKAMKNIFSKIRADK